MDDSKINHSELDYSCSAGNAKVNLFNGRLIFNHFNSHTNTDNFKISIEHIYNSKLQNDETFIGNNWKLNLQQFLYKKEDNYLFVDDVGIVHTFKPCGSNTYYDSDGLGFLIYDRNDELVLEDQANNKYYFENNRMIKKVAGYDETLIEYYNYDKDGKLMSIYHSMEPKNKCLFEYENNLLKKMQIVKDTTVEFELYYYYDNQHNLKRIEYLKDNVVLDNVLFDYINSNMTFAILLSTKEGFAFGYNNNKVISVKKGCADVTNNGKDRNKNNVSEQLFCEENLFIGEKINDQNYDVVINSIMQNVKTISFNNIEYLTYKTIVTNEKSIQVAYHFNKLGYVVSILEANEGNILDLRSLEKNYGMNMMDSGNDVESINTERAHKKNTNYIISTNNIMQNSLSTIDRYRGRKCANYKYFNCTFWLKINQELSSKKVNLVIKESTSKDAEVAQAHVLIDNSAINSWQFVTIPIYVPFNKIGYYELYFDDNSSINTFKIADMRLEFSEFTRLCLTNGTQWEPLDNVKKIKYISSNDLTNTKIMFIDDETYLTDSDLQFTYLDMFKRNGNGAITKDYLMSLSNGSKRIWVKKVMLSTDLRDYEMAFSSDEYGNGSRTNFFQENKFPDGNLYTYSILHCCKNRLIDGSYYDCFGQITEVNKYFKDEDDHKQSYALSYYDLYGNVLFEQDEYGVKTSYKYDSKLNLISKKIFSDETNEQIKYDYTKSNTSNTSLENDCLIKNEFNSIDGRIDKTIFRGKDEEESKEYLISNKYHDYSGYLSETYDNLGGHNYIKYGYNDKPLYISPMPYNSDNMYGYSIEYDCFGSPSNFYREYKNGKSIFKKLIQTKNTDLKTNSIQVNYYRNDDEIDTVKATLDKYGRTESINENGKITTFKRQRIKESFGDAEITEIFDPFDNATHLFEYNEYDKLSSYKIKKENKTIFEITKPTDTAITYQFNTPYLKVHGTDVAQDSVKFISPRIRKTVDSKDVYLNYINTQCESETLSSEYEYDALGRIKQKKRINDSIPFNSIINSFEYKPGSYNKNKVIYELNKKNASNSKYEFNYSHNSRGLISGQTLKIDSNNIDTYNKSYVYDKGNRLICERNQSSNEQINYHYNSDGTISFIEKAEGVIYHKYRNGRLVAIKCDQNSNLNKSFTYDNIGNCTNYNGNILTWERAKLLKKFSSGTNDILYKYNNNGLLVSKEKGLFYHKYIYDNNKLLVENTTTHTIEYLYDKDEMIGFVLYYRNGLRNIFYYIKDSTGNVISIVSNSTEVARYSYDAWGNVTIDYDSNDGIGAINPIRWKSQYYDSDINMYYINKRFYSPEIIQYISSENIESILEGYYTLYSLNLYTLDVANPINIVYNENTIEASINLEYDPPELSCWSRFWRTKSGKVTGIVLGIIAFIAAIVMSAVTHNWQILVGFVKGIIFALGSGSIIAGSISQSHGDSFWRGFANYINENWSQVLAVESVVMIITCGVLFVNAIFNNASKRLFRECKKIAAKEGIDLQKINREDFTEEALEIIDKLKHKKDGSTVSILKDGRDIHNGYKIDMKGKEYRAGKSRKKMDFYDNPNNTIYELKPMNYKSVIKGIKQLKTYDALVGGTNKLVLIVY